MTLSGVMMGTVRALNALDPATRSGILPMRDVQTFRESTEQAYELQTSTMRSPGKPAMPRTPVMQQVNSMAEAADKATEIKVNTHAFAPPGMEMN